MNRSAGLLSGSLKHRRFAPGGSSALQPSVRGTHFKNISPPWANQLNTGTAMSSQTFLHCGGETPRPLELRAGPLTMRFEPQTAFLRHLRLGDHEVVRAIYAAIRDQDWATITPQVAIHEQEVKADSFRIVFDAVCRRGHIDYFWRGTLTGDKDGRVRYVFDGEARSDFQRNRIGFCVLHPIVECAGKPVSIEHSDGSAENGVFPRDISPHQPFFDIKVISYEAAGTGISAKLEMDGDIFEMEDQRNWSDASFKTYCTPQSRPKPHPVRNGDRVQQSVALTLSGKVRSILPVNLGRPPQLSISTTPVVGKRFFCVAGGYATNKWRSIFGLYTRQFIGGFRGSFEWHPLRTVCCKSLRQ